MSLRDEYQEEASILKNADFEEVSGRLIHLLAWMEKQPLISTIISDLKSKCDGAALLTAANRHQPPAAHSPNEIAAVGLAMIEICRDQRVLLATIAMACSIRDRSGVNDISLHSDEALRRYVEPFLNYVMKRLPQDEKITAPASLSGGNFPLEISHSLARFRNDHPDPSKVGFLVMRFEDTPAHILIQEAIVATLKPHGLSVVRADAKRYHDDVLYNVMTYLHGCSFGIAIFERITRDDFNPNVSLEVGYLMAMPKPVILLKDKNLSAMQTDLAGKIYDPFDFQSPSTSIPTRLEQWLRDKGIVTS